MREILLVTLRTRLSILTKKSVRYIKRSLIRYTHPLDMYISSVIGGPSMTFLSALEYMREPRTRSIDSQLGSVQEYTARFSGRRTLLLSSLQSWAFRQLFHISLLC